MDTQSCIVRALEIDSVLLSSNPAAFVKANEFQYSLAIKTWLECIASSSSQLAVEAVKMEVFCQGLVASIRNAVQCSDAIIRTYSQAECPSVEGAANLPATWALCVKALDARAALQILRYLKRFTPIGCDKLDADTISTFLSVQNRNKIRERNELPRYMMPFIKDASKAILADIALTDEVTPDGFPVDLFVNGYFSPGVTWDAVPNCKINKILNWGCPCFGSPLYPSSGKKRERIAQAVVKLVPKNYKTKRTIAEEASYRQYLMQGLRTLYRAQIDVDNNAVLPLTREEVQQRKCFDLRYATIDLSSASDTITCSIASEVLPHTLHKWGAALRSICVRMPSGELRWNYIYQTSGSAFCFDSESHIFASVCQGAQNWMATFTREEYLPVSVFGDDIQCDARCFEVVCEWLTRFGFIVNDDKSYNDGFFRESCGVEVWDGCEVSTSYWPRKEISFHKDSLQSLISLNDRLLSRSYIEAACTVLGAIKELTKDKFTTSSVLTEGYSTDPRTFLTPTKVMVSSRKAYQRDTEEHPDYEGHMVVTMAPSDVKFDIGISDYQMYQYVMFLLHGPLYESDLDRLLHVSTSRLDRKDGMCNMRTSISIRPTI